MKKITPIYNHGRWIVTCPKHGTAGAMLAENEYICPACYPGILAFMDVVRGGRVQRIPDISARKTARLLAEQNDDVYTVNFPAKRKEIEAELAKLPPNKRSFSGRNLGDVKKQVAFERHLIANFAKRNKNLDGSLDVVIVEKQ